MSSQSSLWPLHGQCFELIELTVCRYRDKFIFRFKGIRYAAQPKLFTYSSLYEGSDSVSALSSGPKCVQTGCSGSDCSEDCLFLNIWTPYLPLNGRTPQTRPKDVMFWIHVGAFTGGTGADPTFDGGNMESRGDVVMVAINYHLSALGFLALIDGKTNGNYGLGDIITALWRPKPYYDIRTVCWCSVCSCHFSIPEGDWEVCCSNTYE